MRRTLLRCALVVGVASVAGSGCGYQGYYDPPPGMQCVHAHDSANHGIVCDLYLPKTPMPTVTVTVTPSRRSR